MSYDNGYTSQEVVWKIDGIDVYGTLTRPDSTDTHPGIVFVAGSGPTDQNWESPLIPGTNGSGRLLAHACSKAGFATLRYDKRASGSRIKENLPKLIGKISMQSHLDELKGAVNTLLETPSIDKQRLFILTNSEGAIHALHYQLQMKKNRFKGLVLTGIPGRSVGDVARSQLMEQIARLPNSKEIMRLYDEAVKSFIAGEQIEPDSTLPQGIQTVLQSLVVPANLPFSRELWTTNPSELLAKIKEPVLVVIGKKDIQVDWQADGRPLEEATRNHKNITFFYPENANHVLKHDETPREKIGVAEATAQYNADDKDLDTETVSTILQWLKKR